jgi:hypothetical protein
MTEDDAWSLAGRVALVAGAGTLSSQMGAAGYPAAPRPARRSTPSKG